MFQSELFFGFPVDSHFPKTSYLEEVSLNGVTYIGKKVGPLVELSDLELIESHIHSILQKMDLAEPSLMLFPLDRNE